MAVPSTSVIQFELNQTKFYQYWARDAHGSGCDYLTVDGRQVRMPEFCEAIRAALGVSAPVVRNSMSHRQEYTLAHCKAHPQSVASFSINGVQFLMEPESDPRTRFEVAGEKVGYMQFGEAVIQALGSSRYLVADSLRYLPEDFLSRFEFDEPAPAPGF